METDQVHNEYRPIIYLSVKEGNELKQWNCNWNAEMTKMYLFTCALIHLRPPTWIQNNLEMNFKNVTLLIWHLKVDSNEKVIVVVLAVMFLNLPEKRRREPEWQALFLTVHDIPVDAAKDGNLQTMQFFYHRWSASRSLIHKTMGLSAPPIFWSCVSQHLYIGLWEHNVPGKLVWYKCLT